MIVKHEENNSLYETETKILINGYFIRNKIFGRDEITGEYESEPYHEDWIILPFKVSEEIYKDLQELHG